VVNEVAAILRQNVLAFRGAVAAVARSRRERVRVYGVVAGDPSLASPAREVVLAPMRPSVVVNATALIIWAETSWRAGKQFASSCGQAVAESKR
jgi:hypothetical protein